MRRFAYALIPALVSIALRLYPTFVSGLPFSTDAWPLIRNTELLLERTPIHLGDDTVFDGYNNYWPANSLFGAVFSLVTGLEPIQAMAVGVPLTGALTILVFYALVCKISHEPKLAFFASMLLATAFPYALSTAGVTKETYANPIYMLLILIFLSGGDWKRALLFTMTSVALVLAHHLTCLVALAVIVSVAFAASIGRIREGLGPDKSRLLLALILAVAVVLYLGLYAWRGLKLTLAPSDWLSVASYQIVAFALALYLVSKPPSPRLIGLIGFLVLLSTSASVLISTKISILPGAPVLPSRYLLYAVPLVIFSFLAVLWLRELSQKQGGLRMALSFWFAAVLGLEGYAAFGLETGLTLAYRTIDFLWPPLAVLSAFGLYRLCKSDCRSRLRSLARPVVVVTCLAILVLNSYNLYASVSLQERYMGYFWLYRLPEYEAAAWTAKVVDNRIVAGDVKVQYLLKGYFNTEVDALQALSFLYGKSGSEPQTLFLYDRMLENGYVVYGGYSVDLPGNWVGKISSLNLVYSNSFVNVYAK